MKFFLIVLIFCYSSCAAQQIVTVYDKAYVDSINTSLQASMNSINSLLTALNAAVMMMQPLRDSVTALRTSIQAIKPSNFYHQGFIGDGLTPQTPLQPPPCPCIIKP